MQSNIIITASSLIKTFAFAIPEIHRYLPLVPQLPMKIRNKPLRSLIHIFFFIILVIISSVTPRSLITFNAAILIGEILQSGPIIEA
ncbi:hypothetical protein LguiA_024907 [Lonicera macranthoides]